LQQHQSAGLDKHRTRFRVRYAETDQMGVVYHSNHLIWFKVGEDGDELHLVAEQDPVNTGSGRHFCLVVEDLEATRARLEERGYPTEETTPIPNRPRFFCRDPFGNTIEFTTILGPYH